MFSLEFLYLCLKEIVCNPPFLQCMYYILLLKKKWTKWSLKSKEDFVNDYFNKGQDIAIGERLNSTPLK